MRRRLVKLLEDMQRAALSIQSFLVDRSEADYLGDELLRSAVERRFEVIGEALRRLRSLDASVAGRISQSSQIIDFRNVLAHGYDAVDDRRVWRIASTLLPKLLAEISAIMAEEEQAWRRGHTEADQRTHYPLKDKFVQKIRGMFGG